MIMQLWHGASSAEIDALAPGNRMDDTDLVWAGSKSYAAQYGTPIRVNVEFDYIFDTSADEDAYQLWADYVAENGGADGGSDCQPGFANDGLPHWENNDAVWAIAQANGYDAIRTSESAGRDGYGVRAANVRIAK